MIDFSYAFHAPHPKAPLQQEPSTPPAEKSFLQPFRIHPSRFKSEAVPGNACCRTLSEDFIDMHQ